MELKKSFAWALISQFFVNCGTLLVNVNSSRNPSSLSSSNSVGNGNAHSFQQSIVGNSSTDTVILEFAQPDGVVVTQLTDFRMQSQIVRVIIPGEEELNQPKYQVLCFISSYAGDIIPPEAVMKLRQKNPGTIRVAEEDHGEVIQDSPLLLYSSPIRLASVSSHLSSLCRDARESTFSSEHELVTILSGFNGPKASAISRLASKNYDEQQRCFSTKELRGVPCICSLQVCFNWYPCALKYCKNKKGEGEHRCGIKTCRKCMTFRYPTKSKDLCLWDEI